ncbi:translocation/assembly module TamB domain-containing protein [Helicobacter macacae]|uniref:Uncharacterized protein n=1 Tax=Helicobacter macacae MIT 99-5501 TaxID=1357400 RepID=V8C7X6_9HELI|nr:hypothetical protein [Helicobacter macacae]ETD22861.1 hypothetical protein HMPREF2086_01660 [Helicobacter macacae MIT 99-5501]
MALRILKWFAGIVVGLLLLVYVLVFSPIGNFIFKPVVQSQIDKYSPVPLTLSTFSVGLTGLDIVIKNEPKLEITLKGDYNLFTLNIDTALNINASDISLFDEVAGMPLSGAFVLEASAKGKVFGALSAEAHSNIAKSKTDIKVELQNLNPLKIYADIVHLELAEVLAMIGQKPYIEGVLSLDADIVGNENMEFSGKNILEIKQGDFSQRLIAKDFGIQVPKTTFTIRQESIFDKKDIKQDFVFDSNVGKITLSSTSNIESFDTKGVYSIVLSDISAFTPLLGMKVRGALRTEGSIEGGLENILIAGKTDIADSASTYSANIVKSALAKVRFDTQNLRIEKLLYMIYQPQYISASVGGKAEAWDFDKGISTQANFSLKGVTSNPVIKKEFDLDMPNTPFNANLSAKLDKGVGNANLIFDSNLARLNVPNIAIDLHKGAYSSPYSAILPDLKKLKFATKIELVGKFEANGDFALSENLKATFHTKSLGGNVDAELNGDNFNAKIKEVDLDSVLSMAQIQKVFSSKVNGDLVYNTASEKGTLKARLDNGRFLKNQLTDALKQYAKFDATGLVFNNISLNSDINKMVLNSALNMQSGDFSLSGQNIITDLEKSTINAKLKTTLKKDTLGIKLSGNLTSPKVELDLGELLKSRLGNEVQKSVGKEIEKALDKHIDEGAKKEIGNTLKKLFR